MTNRLTEEIVANTLRISQSLIGKTQLEIMQDKDKGIIHTFCRSKEQSDTEENSYMLSIMDIADDLLNGSDGHGVN